ncbi:MAG: putative phage tail assembly chaperone [Cellvibrionaceae bacterium]
MSNATQLLDAEVNGTNFVFGMTRSAYNKCINAMGPTNKTVPFHNLLVSTIQADQKDELVKLLDENPGAELSIGALVIDQYTPDLDIIVKKRTT